MVEEVFITSARMAPLMIKLCVIFSALNCVLSAAYENADSTAVIDSKLRKIRSPAFLENTQSFRGSVVFNTYLSSGQNQENKPPGPDREIPIIPPVGESSLEDPDDSGDDEATESNPIGDGSEEPTDSQQTVDNFDSTKAAESQRMAGVIRDIEKLTPRDADTTSKIGIVQDKTQNERKLDPTTILESAVSLFGVVVTGELAATAVAKGIVMIGNLGLKIATAIEAFIEKRETREGFLRGLLYEIQFQTESLCNCIVFNLNKTHTQSLTGIKYFKRHLYEKKWFGVWVAEGGSFKNQNFFKDDKWGFAGDFSKSVGFFSNTVKFNHRPCKTVPPIAKATPKNAKTNSSIGVFGLLEDGESGRQALEGSITIFGTSPEVGSLITEGAGISENGTTSLATAVVNGIVSLSNLGFKIAEVIETFIEKKETREKFLRGLLYEIQFQTEGLCNCLVFNLNKKHKNNLKGVRYFKRHEYEKTHFGVWVTEGGSFQNKDKNTLKEKWGFAGKFSLSGFRNNTVTFNDRPCKATLHPAAA